jgi:ubiquinone/menaquinone biosynthesis C-methylase UbiE
MASLVPRRVSESWVGDHPWAGFYDYVVEHQRLGGVLWRLGMGTDLGLLYRAAREIGELPEGAALLDIPCGGGVALAGVRPGQKLRYVAADISPHMLRRTQRRARQLGVLDVLETAAADVGELPFSDGEFDMCITFTGLHCFPDPERAVHEIGRCLRAGGRLSGSAFLNDTGRLWELWRRLGRANGLMGPGATCAQLHRWLPEAGFEEIVLRRSGAMVYFTARRAR